MYILSLKQLLGSCVGTNHSVVTIVLSLLLSLIVLCSDNLEYLQLVIILMTVNFLRAGQILEAPAGTSSKSISSANTATIRNKNEVNEIWAQ